MCRQINRIKYDFIHLLRRTHVTTFFKGRGIVLSLTWKTSWKADEIITKEKLNEWKSISDFRIIGRGSEFLNKVGLPLAECIPY
jgi:hypothetical protein